MGSILWDAQGSSHERVGGKPDLEGVEDVGSIGVWGRAFHAEGTARAKILRKSCVRHVKG